LTYLHYRDFSAGNSSLWVVPCWDFPVADGVELRYEDGTIRTVFYRCDLESYCEAAKFLRDEAVRLGLKIVEEFRLPHFCPPAYHDKRRGMYVYKT
jgi:hypothetical protein